MNTEERDALHFSFIAGMWAINSLISLELDPDRLAELLTRKSVIVSLEKKRKANEIFVGTKLLDVAEAMYDHLDGLVADMTDLDGTAILTPCEGCVQSLEDFQPFLRSL